MSRPAPPQGADPMRRLAAGAHLVRGATAGVALCADGGCRPLPGFPPDDELLVPRSPVLAAARERLGTGHVYSSFLWPVGGRRPLHGHRRLTVLAAPEHVPLR
ncbi:hypothetical protein ACIB24_08280 [Spongisporangium articulatum]|uniref:Uncharacterized protein n=1 Tax=Spongisporangium articulatum TaxID=3362603 RepID=A0ABW8AL30_9ACTN